MSEKRTEPVKVWLTPEDELALRRLADDDERKLSGYIRVVLRKHLAMMDNPPVRVYPVSPVPPGPFRDEDEERLA